MQETPITLTYTRFPGPLISGDAERALQDNIAHGAYLNQGEIYCITNRMNGDKYIGKTKCMKKVNGTLVYRGYQDRFRQHLLRATSDNEETAQECAKFYGAIRYYGWDAFTVELLERCDLSQINQRERYYIKTLNTRRRGYNTARGGVPRRFLRRRGRGKK
jgi:group I intron endonuclease